MSRLLAHRYELGSLIGSGGTARVHDGRDTVLDRRVAIKILDDDAAASNDPARRARFLDEAKSAAQFAHPGAVAVYDAGESDGDLYIVMELVEGRSLAAVIAEEAPLPEATAVRLAAQLLDVLAAIHAAGVVHRDVKPGNVLVDSNGTVKLADFGIAKRFDELVESLTCDGMVIGTRAYLAPELAAGGPPSPAGDQYAVGVLLYELLSGERPPLADLGSATGADVRAVRPEVSAPVAHAVARALAPRPELRFTSVGEMASWLRAERPTTTVMPAPAETVTAVRPTPQAAATALLPRAAAPGSVAVGAAHGVGAVGSTRPPAHAAHALHDGRPTSATTVLPAQRPAGAVLAGPAQRSAVPAGGPGHRRSNAAHRRPPRPVAAPPRRPRTSYRWAVPIAALVVVIALAALGVAARDALPGAADTTTPPVGGEPAATAAAADPAPPETAALPTTPPGTELIPGFPMTDDLDEFIALLGDAQDVAGKRSPKLGDRLRKVADAPPEDRTDAAADLADEIGEWVEDGELDPTVADRARLFLAFLAPGSTDAGSEAADD